MTSTRRGALVLLAFIAAAAWLHALAGHTLPVPWVDEIDFLAPAHALAHHGTLRVPTLSAPEGMFWVSDVYYFLLAPVVRFFPATVTVGRAVSFVAMVAAAFGFWTAGRRAGVRAEVAGFVVGLWLLIPKVVVAANITRHEAIVLACVAWGLAAVVSGRRLAGLTLAGLAVAVHPAGAPFALVVAAGALFLPSKKASRWEWAGAGALAVVLSFEVVHFATNWGVASEQIRFQMQRKAGRQTPARDLGFVVAYLVALFAAVRGASTNMRLAALVAGTAFAGAAISSFGHEMWYGVYGMPTGVMLGALAFAVAAPELKVSLSPRIIEFAAITVVALSIIGSSGYGFYDMRIGDSSSEWTAFVSRVERQLEALDKQTDAPTTIALSGVSDLPWPLVDPKLDNITLVKETMVTTSPDAGYQLVCCRPNVPPTHPAGEVVATISSPLGLFDATLVEIKRSSVPSASS